MLLGGFVSGLEPGPLHPEAEPSGIPVNVNREAHAACGHGQAELIASGTATSPQSTTSGGQAHAFRLGGPSSKDLTGLRTAYGHRSALQGAVSAKADPFRVYGMVLPKHPGPSPLEGQGPEVK